ncbi:MAG: Gfo/Idh/MocA family oxidoreductase, partial [Draconibacterium sp.]|nr:Gfo/Idh/MocA family oxidoreductase [Draconibacterium sp.]
MKQKSHKSAQSGFGKIQEKDSDIPKNVSRRNFMRTAGMGALAFGYSCTSKNQSVVQGFENEKAEQDRSKGWEPFSEQKIRMGIAGYGYCKFGASFGFQNHPNVEIVAVSDLFPDRCAELAKACNCSKTYPSLEELIKDDEIEAVFIATDAPSHAKHAIETLKHGKHVACAVPAVFGSLEDADKLFETVKSSGLKYMLFETSFFRADLYAMRQIYFAGGLGELVYSEGEYYHYMNKALPSYLNWRVGLPPQWYPTHSNAYDICITDGSFTEVSCFGMPSQIPHLKPENNLYKNPFGSEIALFRTNKGGMSRMAVSWDTPGDDGERGRVRGQKGSFYSKYEGLENSLPNTDRPPLPPGVPGGGHGGS